MLKFATAEILSKAVVPHGLSRHARRKFAHRHHFDYEVRPGFLYVRSRAISSRCNDNFDEFPAQELEKAYASFKGKPVFVNHVNEDHKRARGVIIDAALHKDANRDGSKDWWVEVLMEVDALRFPRLAKEILNGNIARTSMGCDVAYSICSACGNKATTPAEYCKHIPGSKGQRIYRTTASGQKVGELIRETCYGLKFFENSLLVEPPADPTAFFLGVDTRGLDRVAHRTAAKDPRFAEVGLGQDEDGHYVKTHRARSKSYASLEDIPQAEVDRIAATGVAKPYGDVKYADPGMRGDKARYPIDTPEHIDAAERYIHEKKNQKEYSSGQLHRVEDAIDHAAEEHGIGDHKAKLAFGETKAPADVDTLREDACPVCGDRDTYDGDTCSVCGYVAPPEIFQDPDLSVARSLDLRKQIGDFTGQPGQPVNPDQLDQNGQMTPTAPGQGADSFDQTGQVQPGTLPGEVQAEVQPATDGPGAMPGVGNGIPDSDGMVPYEPGQDGLLTQDQLGPDGQPTQLPGEVALGPDGQPMQQQPMSPEMLGPDGMPIGPQPLPGNALSGDGQPFHPGPNMPEGPGGPEEPEGPVSPDMLGPDGQMAPTGQQPDPMAGGGVPGTPGDGVPDLSCPACGFTTDATPPTSIDMDSAGIPPTNMATPDGVQAGDICPNCGQGLLMSPAEVTGDAPVPMPGAAVPPR